jgi:type IV pilus assembly protein PilY1
VFVGSEDYGYYNLPTTEGSAYQSFMNSKLSNRPRMIYVGSNDGMLHGFEAGSWDTAKKTFKAGTGDEVFAYTPGIIVNKNLRSRAYYREGTYNHTYLVDGSARVGDAYFKDTDTGTCTSSGSDPCWHTVLLGTTGASPSSIDPQDHPGQLKFPSGGRGIFALDVTDPSSFNKNYPTGKAKLLWELNNWTPPDSFWQLHGDSDLGMTMAQPSLARMQNGKWAVIAANGYNSVNQKPVLYLLDVSRKPGDTDPEPFIMKKFCPCNQGGDCLADIPNGYCPTGVANGLSTPIAVDVNNDRRVDYIYAGDLTGNLWKFDVNCPSVDDENCFSSTAPTTLNSAWHVANNGKPLFVACTQTGTTCDVGNRQPITSKPQVGSVSALQGNAVYSSSRTKPSVMVYFGTGKYLELADRSVDSRQTQTFYALWDKNAGDWKIDNSISDRSHLQAQTIVESKITQFETDTTALDSLRVTSENPTCYDKTIGGCKEKKDEELKLGWYMDLTTSNNSPSERVISFPLLLNGNILFTTIIPSPDPCVTDPISWIMELDAITGSRPTTSPFDLFGGTSSPDGKVNDYDMVFMKEPNEDGATVAPSGLKSTVGMVKTPAVLPNKDVVDKFFGGSTGAIQKVTDPGESLGRVSWRQLR